MDRNKALARVYELAADLVKAWDYEKYDEINTLCVDKDIFLMDGEVTSEGKQLLLIEDDYFLLAEH